MHIAIFDFYYINYSKHQNMNITVVIYFSIVFFLSEIILAITKHSQKKMVKNRKDKNSLTLFWITIPVSITIGFFAAKYQAWSILNVQIAWFGLSLFITGLVIRWLSILQLKKEFTVDVSITKNHKLKTDGMYKNVRHPSYSGLLLTVFGLSIAMNSIISLLVLTIPVFFAVLYRIKAEELILTNEFGEVYKSYTEQTHKLIPKIF